MLAFQISDDEDDTHPNIDTPSLFKWRHEARVQRMEEQKQEKDKLQRNKSESVCVRVCVSCVHVCALEARASVCAMRVCTRVNAPFCACV